MENITDYIGKSFIQYSDSYFGKASIYKIIAFDSEKEKFICRDDTYHNNFSSYSGFSIDALNKKAIFDKEKFLLEIDGKIKNEEEAYKELSKLKEIMDKDLLLEHNIKGVCEGFNNIKWCQNLVKNYEKSPFKRLNGVHYVLFYNKEIKNFEKGIRRNKKVLFRLLSKEDYDFVISVCNAETLDYLYEKNRKIYNLKNQKEKILEKFKEIEGNNP